jgi:hypothetical protein
MKGNLTFSKGFKIKSIPQIWFLIFFKGVHNKGYPTYGLIVSLIMKGNLIFKWVQNKGYPQAWFLIFFKDFTLKGIPLMV